MIITIVVVVKDVEPWLEFNVNSWSMSTITRWSRSSCIATIVSSPAPSVWGPGRYIIVLLSQLACWGSQWTQNTGSKAGCRCQVHRTFVPPYNGGWPLAWILLQTLQTWHRDENWSPLPLGPGRNSSREINARKPQAINCQSPDVIFDRRGQPASLCAGIGQRK